MNPFFVEALDLREHPIKKARKNTQITYITALTYIVEKTIVEAELREIKGNQHTDTKRHISEKLHLYQNQLFADSHYFSIASERKRLKCVAFFSPKWHRKYLYMLMCDVSLILLDKYLILYATKIMEEYLPTKRQADIGRMISLLHNNQNIEKKYLPAISMIKQYRANYDFFAQKEKRIIVTANMSAGKSTLINALAGKPLARTSQETCTGNTCFFFNKAYEDGNIYLSTQELNLRATADDLHSYDWNEQVSIASYFTGAALNVPRLCIIDTPGVDAILYKEHSERAHTALLDGHYDTIIYVVSPTHLGTDAEKKHLQWVAQNLQKDKIIFVLNKLDDYRDFSDSIEESVHNFKEDLLKIGFENPIICPISAYFSYLLKMRMRGQALTEDEEDEYTLYAKKFNRSLYDLSHYYEGVQCLPTDSEEIALSKRAGLYGLEKIIYGGTI